MYHKIILLRLTGDENGSELLRDFVTGSDLDHI